MNGLAEQMSSASIIGSTDSIRGQSAIVALKGLPQTMVAKEKLKKSDKIRQHMSPFGKIGRICSDGSANCLIQFEDRSAFQKLMASTKNYKDDQGDGSEQIGKLVVEGHEVTIRLLTELEENDYWNRVKKKKELSAKKKSDRKKKNENVSQTADSRTKCSEMDMN